MNTTSTVMVTGASSGIGAVYADRFARRGHDVILVARDESRLADVARDLRRRTEAGVEIVRADLTVPSALADLEQRLRHDDRIEILVNNAGLSAPGRFTALQGDRIDELVALNVTAPTRLTAAIAPRLAREGRGAVITVASMVGLMPEYGQALYGATKAYLLFLSESLHHELDAEGVYLQAVLPAGTRTGIFTRTGRDVNAIPGIMDAEEMVDAALVGFDRREPVTMPSVPDPAAWQHLAAARARATASAAQSHAAARYRTPGVG